MGMGVSPSFPRRVRAMLRIRLTSSASSKKAS